MDILKKIKKSLRKAKKKKQIKNENAFKRKYDKDCCYICGGYLKNLSQNDIVAVGKGRYRHKGCDIGSINWLKYRKDSKYYSDFIGGKK